MCKSFGKHEGPGMAHYLVTASPREQLLDELRNKLAPNEFARLRPFGRALSSSLRRARRLPNGRAIVVEGKSTARIASSVCPLILV